MKLRDLSWAGTILAAGFVACLWLLTHFVTAEDARGQEARADVTDSRVTALEKAEAVTATRLDDLKEQVKEIARAVGARVMP